MTVTEWTMEELRRISAFEKWWHTQAEASPEHFPVFMEPGEWDEQYRAWESMEVE